MANKNLSVLILSFSIFILGFLVLQSSYPNIFKPDENNPNKCFFQFFATGVLAILIYWTVSHLCE
tara:strand:- start:580 stop:774 length:195 start_codon:yes stop_codon:yes gene_type:complete